MTRPLLLLTASGLAREVAEAARALGREVLGFLDDDPARRGEELLPGAAVLGSIDTVVEYPNVGLVVCAGKGQTRKAIVGRVGAFGAARERFDSVIDATVVVPPTCSVGLGSVLLAGTVLTSHVAVGDHVVAMPHVVITHDCVIEDYATMCAGVVLGGSVRVGEAAYLGMACSAREGVRIGTQAMLGMGSVVLHEIPAGETWIGVPAAPQRARC